MGVGIKYSLQDVKDEMQAYYETAQPNTLSGLANNTNPVDLLNGVAPTKLSDWEGFPKQPEDHWGPVSTIANGWVKNSIITNTAINPLIWNNSSYNDGLDIVTDNNNYDVDIISIRDGMDKPSFVVDNLISSTYPDIQVTDIQKVSIFTEGECRTVSNGSSSVIESTITDGINNNSLYIHLNMQLGSDSIILCNEGSFNGSAIFHRVFTHVLGADVVGTLCSIDRKTVEIFVGDEEEFIRGGYIYKVTGIGQTVIYKQVGFISSYGALQSEDMDGSYNVSLLQGTVKPIAYSHTT